MKFKLITISLILSMLTVIMTTSCTPRSAYSPPSKTNPTESPDGPKPGPSLPPPVVANVNGLWRTDCHLDAENPETSYQRKSVKFSNDGSLEYIAEAFAGTDKMCKESKIFTTILTGKFQLGSKGIDAPLDMSFQRRILVPGSLDTVKLFNEMRVCGVTDWSSGSARDVTSANCESGTGMVSQNVFSSLRVDADSIRLGKDSLLADGSTVEKRHSVLSDIRFLKTKQ